MIARMFDSSFIQWKQAGLHRTFPYASTRVTLTRVTWDNLPYAVPNALPSLLRPCRARAAASEPIASHSATDEKNALGSPIAAFSALHSRRTRTG